MGRNIVFHEVGLVLYPNVQLSAVHGLTDLFLIANEQALNRDKFPAQFRVTHWQLATDEPLTGDEGTENKLRRVYSSEISCERQPDCLIIPPSLSAPISKQAAAPIAAWISEHHAAGTTVCSICAGIFLLAETDIANDQTVTTHWNYALELARRFPKVSVDTEKLLVVGNGIVTAGGLMAWIDLGLHLVERVLGAATMFDTARFLVVDPPARDHRAYNSFIPEMGHGDSEILALQHWLQDNQNLEFSLKSMVDRAQLNERTLIRRFLRATGLRPTEYCQHLRLNKARDLLELTDKTIDEISCAVGYENPGALRKIFLKHLGLSPSQYRSRSRPTSTGRARLSTT